MRRGAPLHEIGQLLRHRDIETTAIYANLGNFIRRGIPGHERFE